MAGRPDRLWAIGGAVAAVVVLVVSWFVLIGPKYTEHDELRTEQGAAEAKMPDLRARLAELSSQDAEKPRYQAQLARDRQALPTTAGLSDFLRDLQTSGERAGVVVSGFNAGNATDSPVAGVKVIPVTISVAGDVDRLRQFLNQLQQVQPRAVLILSGTLSPAGDEGTFTGTVTLTLNAQVFVADIGGATSPSAPAGAGATPPEAD